MFPWFWCFIGFSLVEHTWFRYLDFRQLKHGASNPPLHPKLSETVSSEAAAKSRAYSHDKLCFGLLESSVSVVLQMSMYLFLVYPRLWSWSVDLVDACFSSSSEILQAIAFLGLQYVLGRFFSLPFELYYDFVLEERHGFNKKTLRVFITDELKQLFLTFAIGAPVTALVVAIVRWSGPRLYIWLWLASVALTFIMLTIYPIWIAPWFNKYEPLKNEDLRDKIGELARKIKFPLAKIYQMDASLRSSHSNAYMYGFWKNKRIVLFDTLLEQPEDQILAILGHELGHWKCWHTVTQMTISFAHMFGMFYLFGIVVFDESLYRDFGFDSSAVIVGLFLFMNIYSPVALCIGILTTCLSRYNEFQADEFATKLGMGSSLQAGLVEIHKKNLSSLSVDKLYAWFNYSHPHLVERLEAIQGHVRSETPPSATAKPEIATGEAEGERQEGERLKGD